MRNWLQLSNNDSIVMLDPYWGKCQSNAISRNRSSSTDTIDYNAYVSIHSRMQPAHLLSLHLSSGTGNHNKWSLLLRTIELLRANKEALRSLKTVLIKSDSPTMLHKINLT